MKISVVVCTRDRPELLKDCLDALSHSRLHNLEILVVDQSVGTGSAEVTAKVARDDARIRHISASTVGLSRARNIGVRQSEGGIIAFTDDDCVPAADWPAAIMREFRDNPDISAVYGRCLAYDSVAPGERAIGLKVETRRRVFSGRCNPWQVGHGNNMAFRRGIIDKVGGFDEALGPGGVLLNCDDADFTYRVLRQGFSIVYSPSPVIFHKQFRHGKDLWRLEEDYGIGAGALYSKHLRCGDLFVLWLIVDRWMRAGVAHILYGALTLRPNHLKLGYYRIYHSARGLWAARKFHMSVGQRVFAHSAAGEQSDESQPNIGNHLHPK